MKAALLAIGWIAVFPSQLLAFQATQTQSSPSVSGQVTGADPLLLLPPKTPEDVNAREQLARAHLEALRPTTQPATQPTEEAAIQLLAARSALFQDWETYLALLRRNVALRESIATLSSEEHIQALTRQLDELKQKIEAISEQPPPLKPTEEEVAEATATYGELEGRLTALSELQGRRAAQLATGFKEQRDRWETELKELRTARQQEQALPETAVGAEELRQVELRQLDVRIARIELSLQVLSLEKEQTEVAHTQDERRLESLRQYLAAYREWLSALTQARGRRALETIEGKRDRVTEAHELAFLDIEHFCESIRGHYLQSQHALRGRFSETDQNQLKKRIDLLEGIWGGTIESSKYRAGRELLRLHREVRQEQAGFKTELAGLRGKHVTSLSELHQLKTAEERALVRFRSLEESMSAAVQSATAAEQTRLETAAASLKSELRTVITATIDEAKQHVSHLSDAIEAIEEHLTRLRTVEDELYWAALKRRDAGLVGLDWVQIKSELAQLFGMQSAETVATKPGVQSLVAAGILGTAPDLRANLTDRFHRVSADIRTLRGRDWAVGLVLLVLVGVPAGWLRRIAKKHVRQIRECQSTPEPGPETDESARQFSEHMNLFSWHLAMELPIPLALVVTTWMAGWAAELPSRTALPLVAMLSLLLGLYVSLKLVRRLFDLEPDQRTIPCNQDVAGHYRYWSHALLLFALIVLPILTFLATLDVAEGIRALLWEVWKTGVLLILLGFLIRKARVAGRATPRQGGWISAIVAALYPLPIIGVLGLLVLQVIGYGVLVEYLGTGVLASGAVLILLVVVVEYLCDLLDAYIGVAGGTVEQQASDADPTAVKSGDYVVRLLKSLTAHRRRGGRDRVDLSYLGWRSIL